MFKTKKYCECLNLLLAKNKLLETLEIKTLITLFRPKSYILIEV